MDTAMSQYDSLWKYIAENKNEDFKMTFEEIGLAGGVPLDHSFLRYKKELEQYGFKVGKISLKEQTVLFEKLQSRRESDIDSPVRG